MNTLTRDSDRAEIAERIAGMTPASQRRWGSMPAGGMICHLDDSYRLALGEITAASVPTPIPPPVMKFLALRFPAPWPKNIQTVEEVRQGGAGTPPSEFTEDQRRLLATLERFCACPDLDRVKHPFFGAMTHADWMRWGYLHADHHLRQFGV